LLVNPSGSITNVGTYEFQADNSFLAGTGDNRTLTFINQGIVRKSSGTADARSALHIGIFDNDGGSFEIQTGKLGLGAALVTSTAASAFIRSGAGVLDLADFTQTTYVGQFRGELGSTVILSSGQLNTGAGGATFSSPSWQWLGGTVQAQTGLTNTGKLI